MEVSLTITQFEQLRKILGSELRFSLWIDRAEESHHRQRLVVMPAVAWLRVREQLAQRCFTATGGRNSKVPPVWGTMLKRVARALAERQAHPALHGEGLLGRWGELIPVWVTPDGLSQFPVLDSRFGVLVPDWGQVGTQPLTVWTVKDPPFEDLLLDERQHLAFGIV